MAFDINGVKASLLHEGKMDVDFLLGGVVEETRSPRERQVARALSLKTDLWSRELAGVCLADFVTPAGTEFHCALKVGHDGEHRDGHRHITWTED